MKKTKVLFLSLAAGTIFAGSTAFAQVPSSNTKTVTSGLIEDGLVDVIDTGIEGKSIFFGGYERGSGLIEAGYGSYFGDGLWLSLYDGWFMNASETKTESVTNDGVALDGVNTDYTDVSKSAETEGSKSIKNNLAFSAFFNNKTGGTLWWNTVRTKYSGYSSSDPAGVITPSSGKTVTSSSEESHAENTASKKEYSSLENKDSADTIGITFNGVRADFTEDTKAYVKLNQVSLAYTNRYIDLAWKTDSTVNASAIDAKKHPLYSGTYDFSKYTPYVEFEGGFTMKKIADFITPSFVLIEGFKMSFRNNENTFNYKELTTNTNSTLVSKNTDYSLSAGDYLEWSNTETPRFNFAFDAGQGITLKARAQAAVPFSGKSTSADKYTTTVTTSTTDRLTGLTTLSRTVTEEGDSTEEDVFAVDVNPVFSLGMVYEVIPEKFNISFGVTASSGTLSWTKTTRKNSYIPSVSTTTYTNEAGETTVTANSVTPANGDGTSGNDAGSDLPVLPEQPHRLSPHEGPAAGVGGLRQPRRRRDHLRRRL